MSNPSEGKFFVFNEYNTLLIIFRIKFTYFFLLLLIFPFLFSVFKSSRRFMISLFSDLFFCLTTTIC